MAIVAIIPTAQTSVDLGDGNHFEIFKVFHDGVNDTAINVSDNCVSAAVLTDDMLVGSAGVSVIAQVTTETSGMYLIDQSSGTSGLSFGSWQTSDGVKQITISLEQAPGTYFVVARFTGSGAGSGSGAKTLDF